MTGDIHLERWSDADAELLAALNGDEAQMAHVGGAETAEKIAERQGRYVADPGQYVVVDGDGAKTGWVGFWKREWRGETVYEIGWSILPAFQGRGLASAGAALVVEEARAAGEGVRAIHAFPGVGNAASNAVCRRVGFTLVEADMRSEYPPGRAMVCNDWRLEL